ncbi:hypothetical protein [Gemelliphila palaticanis]|uniref:Uncharacterized protein n=1 Tax=Gemelliphila palaticanis TaxID=81950 RepID=A0ABX2SZ01_9BACL|nr:hypothetical protein [Gemella palaticanis]MBF0714657.1 hypothetical protein [Gemella palaticanis]NYS46587.1 hypothetical protein [Gemella palaticanis]
MKDFKNIDELKTLQGINRIMVLFPNEYKEFEGFFRDLTNAGLEIIDVLEAFVIHDIKVILMVKVQRSYRDDLYYQNIKAYNHGLQILHS